MARRGKGDIFERRVITKGVANDREVGDRKMESSVKIVALIMQKISSEEIKKINARVQVSIKTNEMALYRRIFLGDTIAGATTSAKINNTATATVELLVVVR